jgi:hypothetical protein
MIQSDLPELPFENWTDTRITLHLIFQIIGKTRLKLTARKNHWWYITLYVSPRGFTTHGIPVDNGMNSLEILLDVRKKAVVLIHSDAEPVEITLQNGLSIANFYRRFMGELGKLNLHPRFIGKPFDMGIDKTFEQLEEYRAYNWEYIDRFWRVMMWNNAVFQEFSGRFYGKTCPVHLYWHHMDLVVTRFSGKKLPPMDASARISDKDAYSHEQISFGFWVGDNDIQKPMYYSYTYPSPKGIENEVLSPDEAFWQDANGSPMALLAYEEVRNSEDPVSALLSFLESAYQAGASGAGWDINELRTPPLDQL